MRAVQMAAEEDVVSREIMREVGPFLKGFELFHNSVLVATFIRPDRTKSGLLLARQTVDEDLYQGKAGLVLMVGPGAFVDDASNQFWGKSVQAGEWIGYRASDGFQLMIGKTHCRILQDSHVKMRLAAPDSIM